MKKNLLIIAFILVSFVSVSAQNIGRKEIKGRDIEWSDFVGAVDKSSEYDAVTSWVITYAYPRPTFEGNKLRVKVTARLFLHSNSWVKPNKQTPRLLNHERGHFNIGKICARQIEKTIYSTTFDRSEYAKQIDAIYWATIKKCIELEKQYDTETDHYRNQAQQALWDKKLNYFLKL